MDEMLSRIRININNFKYPRNEMEYFSFTLEEKIILEAGLDKLESMLSVKGESIFSISKQNGVFRGSLKINSSNIYTHGKASTGLGLFYKLCRIINLKIC